MGFLIGLNGRIGRGEYWIGNFINFVLMVAGFFISGLSIQQLASVFVWSMMFGFVPLHALDPTITYRSVIILVVTFLVVTTISVSLIVKRYHDRGKSGAWYFLVFVPIVGPLMQFFELFFMRGTNGPNMFDGSNPSPSSSSWSDEPTMAYTDIDAKIAAMKRGEYKPMISAAPTSVMSTRARTSPSQTGFGKRGYT